MSLHNIFDVGSTVVAQHEMLHKEDKERAAKPVRRVRFANRTKIYLVPALSDMSDDEYEAAWNTDEESKAIQNGIVHTIKAMRTGSKDPDTCFRGLEHMRSAAHLEQRKINKESVLQAVLDEQERQWSIGDAGHEEIASAASTNSEWARELAASLGESDAASARRVHGEDERCLSALQMALNVSGSRGGQGSDPTPARRRRRNRSASWQDKPAEREQPPRAKSVDASSRFQGEVKHQQVQGGKALNAGVNSTSNLRNMMAQGRLFS